VATATHIPTKLLFAQGALTANQTVNFNDTTAARFRIMAVKAGSGIPSTSSSGIQFVADITSTNAEDTLIGSRQNLTGVTWANDASLGVVDFSFSNVVYAQAGGDDGLTRYFVIYYTGVGAADATWPVVAILDPGQLVSVVNGSLTIQCPTGGLIQFTGGG
jgi:hypothetical protein